MPSPSPRTTSQIAASVEFAAVARPSNIPENYKASASASLQFLALKAMDGNEIEASLWHPTNKEVADTAIVIMAHGDTNYYSAPQSILAPGLANKGYAALTFNTRNHDGNIYSQNFMDIRPDLDAAVRTARALGYGSLFLQGHSQGNIHVQFYAATNWDRHIRGLILLGAFANLPWKTRHLLVQNEGNFRALIDASLTSLRDGTYGADLPVKLHSFTGHDVPITGQHFLTYRWEKTSVADGTFWISRIPKPILLVRDQADAFVPQFELQMLLSAANSEGSLATSIKSVVLPNALPPSPQGHYFVGNEAPLIEVVAAWLDEQRL
jgi:pimeloyl-ACP methyl ester carboxylesterase